MLSLYLKILEGETTTSLGKQQLLFPKETFLPDLKNNIKCGNSLIEDDFDPPEITDEELIQANPFNWSSEFPFLKKSRFDAVIGNPPWGATLTPNERAYLSETYSRVVARMVDSYIYFTDKACLLAGKTGKVAFVVPSTVLNQVDATPVRDVLLNRGIGTVASLGEGIFGNKVLNTTTVFVSEKRSDTDDLYALDISKIPLLERKNKLNTGELIPWKSWKETVESDPHKSFLVSSKDASELLKRLRKMHGRLLDLLEAKIQRGVSPDVVEAHVVTKRQAVDLELETEFLRTSISGSQIKCYRPFESDQLVIYTRKGGSLAKAPNIRGHLAKFKAKNTCKEVSTKKHPWWALHRARKETIFNSPKIIGLTTAKTIQLVFDENENLVVTDAMYVFRPKKRVNAMALMAIMQSRVFLYLYRLSNQGDSRVIPQVKAAKLHEVPFPSAG